MICSLSLFITYVDATILNVALPAIERQFHAGIASLQWVADAYLLVLACLLMASGSTADRIGRRKVFSTGLVVFSAGSLMCSLAPSVSWLVAFRMLQAVGGCMLAPVSLSIVRQVFTDPSERARAFGVWSGIFGLGVACGPILGGLLVTAVGWRSVFWVNVPIGVAASVLTRRFVPESRAPRPRRVDVPGQLLVAVLLGCLTLGVIEGPELGWGSTWIVVSFVVAAGSGVALVLVEPRRPEPLMDLRFFRSPPFSVANGIAVLSYMVLSGFLFVNTLYLQEVRGDSPLLAGISVLPATAMIGMSSLLSGRLVARFGTRLPFLAGSLSFAAGSALLLDLRPATPYAVLAASYALLGFGLGLINPPITNTAVTGMPAARAGVASAIASTSRQVGSVLGVAVMGSMVTGAVAASESRLGSGRRLDRVGAAALTHATHLPWELAVASGVLCAAGAMRWTGKRGLAAAARVYRDEMPVPFS